MEDFINSYGRAWLEALYRSKPFDKTRRVLPIRQTIFGDKGNYVAKTIKLPVGKYIPLTPFFRGEIENSRAGNSTPSRRENSTGGSSDSLSVLGYLNGQVSDKGCPSAIVENNFVPENGILTKPAGANPTGSKTRRP